MMKSTFGASPCAFGNPASWLDCASLLKSSKAVAYEHWVGLEAPQAALHLVRRQNLKDVVDHVPPIKRESTAPSSREGQVMCGNRGPGNGPGWGRP